MGDTVIAFFADGNRVILPIQADLPVGEVFYCGQREAHFNCAPLKGSGQNWDPHCVR